MYYKYPHTIENCTGEKLIFLGTEPSDTGDKLLVEGFCQPGAGPLMHTHFKQDEALTVVSGRMGYQILGEAPTTPRLARRCCSKEECPTGFGQKGNNPCTSKGG